MDAIALARWQFGITTVYHFFFVPLTLGLAWLVALMHTLYVMNGQEVYKTMTKFWGKLFLINFAMGVVTGIVQEFQFGMNWSEYSRFVGDIFGAPLAIEALLAFFLESTFLGVWIFGWDKLPKKVHLASIWLVAIGSNISALWILIANSFMQQPLGYTLRNGRAEMTDFIALLFNPNVQVQFPHVIASGLVTAAFFMLGISAWHLLRQSNLDLFRRSFQLAAIVGLLAMILVVLNGHSQAQHMVQTQPMKMAAAEALFDTESPASFSLFTVGDLTGRREVFALRLPTLLSLLSYNQLNGEVKGINDLQKEFQAKYGPGDYVPPTGVIYWTFRLMVGAGFLMLLLAAYGLFLSLGEMLTLRPRLMALLPFAIVLPYLANSSGWIMTEMGRAPWIVYGLMKIENAVSPNVGAGAVLLSLVGFAVVYGALMVADIYLLAKFARQPALTGQPAEGLTAAPSLVGAD
ncbi:MAG: cytochrome ubiquinol oxidase subunit I [Anaerolineae bacterium]|nr:cytochrome ubiquinol oxidase subunit I [Anaerolineae bacterium]